MGQRSGDEYSPVLCERRRRGAWRAQWREMGLNRIYYKTSLAGASVGIYKWFTCPFAPGGYLCSIRTYVVFGGWGAGKQQQQQQGDSNSIVQLNGPYLSVGHGASRGLGLLTDGRTLRSGGGSAH